MTRLVLTLLFINIAQIKSDSDLNQRNLIDVLGNKLEHKLTVYAINIGKWLENINDKHFNNSELGRALGYNEIKYKFQTIESERGMKKMSMTLLPVIFQVGAASTWMLLTALLAAKSVAIGIMLLVFKIAVSSAKVASFFTAWKSKHHHHDHSWSPHYDYHGHDRSLRDTGTYSNSFHPGLLESSDYTSIPNSYTHTHTAAEPAALELDAKHL